MVKVKGRSPHLDGAFTAMTKEHAEAFLVLDVPVPIIHQKCIADLRLSTVYPRCFWAAAECRMLAV
jgi:hypothetical protein